MLETRQDAQEQEREASLLALIPQHGDEALDIGARDCYYYGLLADRFAHVVALDLEQPQSSDPRITTIAGNITALDFDDRSFDAVLCAEVLEHIPPSLLETAAHELARVTRGSLVIGVPFEQDLRVARTTCRNCGAKNPPWGHVNSFDLDRLKTLFAGMDFVRSDTVGTHLQETNAVSAWLLDLAGNPYGTYEQDEPCVECDAPIGSPAPRSMRQRLLTKAAYSLRNTQEKISRPKPRWLHALFAAHDP